MALLLHGGLLGGMGGEAGWVEGPGEGAWTLATPLEGFYAASRTDGELAHLLHLCLFRAFHVARACARRTAPQTLVSRTDVAISNINIDFIREYRLGMGGWVASHLWVACSCCVQAAKRD